MIVGYLLCNRFGELLPVSRHLEETVAKEIVADGWVVYRQVVA